MSADAFEALLVVLKRIEDAFDVAGKALSVGAFPIVGLVLLLLVLLLLVLLLLVLLLLVLLLLVLLLLVLLLLVLLLLVLLLLVLLLLVLLLLVLLLLVLLLLVLLLLVLLLLVLLLLVLLLLVLLLLVLLLLVLLLLLLLFAQASKRELQVPSRVAVSRPQPQRAPKGVDRFTEALLGLFMVLLAGQTIGLPIERQPEVEVGVGSERWRRVGIRRGKEGLTSLVLVSSGQQRQTPVELNGGLIGKLASGPIVRLKGPLRVVGA